MYTDLSIGTINIRISSESPSMAIKLPVSYNNFISPVNLTPPDGTLHIVDASATGTLQPSDKSSIVSTGFNDLGTSHLYFDGTDYTIGISPSPGVEMKYMTFTQGFNTARLALIPGDAWNTFIIDSMTRIFFSQIAILKSSFLLHASAVTSTTGSHLFMGKSGTGKSTHSALWLNAFDGYTLLNDDNPLVQLLPDGSVTVSGTPWSGKTKCWINRSARLLSMTRLRQSPVNRYTPLSDVSAFITTLPGISVISHSRMLHDRMCHTLSSITEKIKVGILDCRPDMEAAYVCRNNILSE